MQVQKLNKESGNTLNLTERIRYLPVLQINYLTALNQFHIFYIKGELRMNWAGRGRRQSLYKSHGIIQAALSETQ